MGWEKGHRLEEKPRPCRLAPIQRKALIRPEKGRRRAIRKSNAEVLAEATNIEKGAEMSTCAQGKASIPKKQRERGAESNRRSRRKEEKNSGTIEKE